MQPDLHLPTSILDAASAGAAATRRAIERLGGTPLLSPGAATFLFVGDADGVELTHWMDIFSDTPPMERVAGTALWATTVAMPDEARFEYKLLVRSGGRTRTILDPLNPLHLDGPFGANSVVRGPAYERPAWSIADPDVPSGSIEPIVVPSLALGGDRTVPLYRPAGTAPHEPLPLLVVHDGSEYVAYASLAVALDNLIHAGEIPPITVALSDPVERNAEYTGNASHADHVIDEISVAITDRVAIDPSRVVLMGASLGAVASLHAAHRHPGRVSGLILHSGSFVTKLGGRFQRGPVFDPVVEFVTTFLEDPGDLPGRIFVSCGRFDGLVHENRALADFLTDRGVDARYAEVPDGHDWANWRDRLRSSLRHVFGG